VLNKQCTEKYFVAFVDFTVFSVTVRLAKVLNIVWSVNIVGLSLELKGVIVPIPKQKTIFICGWDDFGKRATLWYTWWMM